MISVSERGLTSTQRTEYNDGTKRTRYSSVPTSNTTAETVVADDFTLSQKDTAGITTTSTRTYAASGMVLTQTDGRGNTTTTETDIAGRTLMVTDVAGNVTTTVYDTAGYIRTAYTYSPYGKVTANGDVTQSPQGLGGGLDKPEGFAPQGRAAGGAAVSQPIQWSSEYADTDLAFVYYNYRHYNPLDGRWTGRDKLEEADHFNVYGYVKNLPVGHYDIYGNGLLAWMGLIAVISLFLCALRAAVKAVEYSCIDKRQHCCTTCYMANYCGGKLLAALIATLKEVLDASYALIQRDFGIISGERYKNIIVDSN